MHVKVQISRHKGGRPHTQNIDMTRPHQLVHHTVKILSVGLVRDQPELVEVGPHHGGQHILTAQHTARRLDALGGGQAAADHLLQGSLHGGIAVEAQLIGKTDHRGFADARQLAQFTGGHERRLVIVLHDIGGNALLSFGKAAHAVFQCIQDAFSHNIFLRCSSQFQRTERSL